MKVSALGIVPFGARAGMAMFPPGDSNGLTNMCAPLGPRRLLLGKRAIITARPGGGPAGFPSIVSNAVRGRNPSHRQVDTLTPVGYRGGAEVHPQLPNLMVYLRRKSDAAHHPENGRSV